ncbi:DUF4221 family protein [Algoriphagus sp. D3-2-R+10]|uniref:DUF4221 family protein n=1 Tax=Algoriphagus aurantiacus TaxID=3103948 RepID=UPI002B3CEC22|nr:DUF4221 family protein [Algoriphagus sp. D3-2-R+10]MEB2776586.1 DUF4221 family protein [Algoriphagus sp. D3-2-R+10]
MNRFLILVIALLSCNTEKKSEYKSEADFIFTYTSDTVVVDAGDHFFFLNQGLGISDVSSDRKYLYNLNPESLILEIVDLDNLKLKETVQLDNEGPNGVGGGYLSRMQVLENGDLCLFDFNRIVRISPKGELLKSYQFDQRNLKGYELEENQHVSYRGVFSENGNLYVAELENFRKPSSSSGLVIIDLLTDSINYIPMALFQKLDQFRISMEMSGGGTMSIGESVYLDFMGDELIISSSAYNEVFRHNSEKDSLYHHEYKANLTSNTRIGNFATTVSSREEWSEASALKNQQVSFRKFYEFPEQEMYWRYSRDKNGPVITFFDSDFVMIKEQTLRNFHNSSNIFLKDGMLYSYLNIDDELAFVRLTPKFK